MLVNIEITSNERDIIRAALADLKSSLYDRGTDTDTRIELSKRIETLQNKL